MWCKVEPHLDGRANVQNAHTSLYYCCQTLKLYKQQIHWSAHENTFKKFPPSPPCSCCTKDHPTNRGILQASSWLDCKMAPLILRAIIGDIWSSCERYGRRSTWKGAGASVRWYACFIAVHCCLGSGYPNKVQDWNHGKVSLVSLYNIYI